MPITRPPYSPEFRQQVLDPARAGRDPVSLSKGFEPTAAAIRKWGAAAGRQEGGRRNGDTQAVAGDGWSATERGELARTSPWSWVPGAAKPWAGPWPTTCAPSWCWTRREWPSASAGRAM